MKNSKDFYDSVDYSRPLPAMERERDKEGVIEQAAVMPVDTFVSPEAIVRADPKQDSIKATDTMDSVLARLRAQTRDNAHKEDRAIEPQWIDIDEDVELPF